MERIQKTVSVDDIEHIRKVSVKERQHAVYDREQSGDCGVGPHIFAAEEQNRGYDDKDGAKRPGGPRTG